MFAHKPRLCDHVSRAVTVACDNRVTGGGRLPPRLCIATGGSARDVTHSITSIIQSFVNKCNNSNICILFYLDNHLHSFSINTITIYCCCDLSHHTWFVCWPQEAARAFGSHQTHDALRVVSNLHVLPQESKREIRGSQRSNKK